MISILSLFFFAFSIIFSQDFFDLNNDDHIVKTNKTWKDSIPSNMPMIKKPFWSEDGLFRKYGIAPESRYKELILRKNMLQSHQKIALINLGLMGYQYYLGREIDQDRAPLILGYEKYNKYKKNHKKLGYTTFSIYMTSAGLSIFSPPALKYNDKLSSIKLHSYLSVIHFLGMSAQPWLGYQSVNSNNTDYYENLHRKTGDVIFISYLLSFLLTLLP